MDLLANRLCEPDENGVRRLYVEIGANSNEAANLPTENIASGSLAFFSNNWTVSAFTVGSGWGEPEQIFG